MIDAVQNGNINDIETYLKEGGDVNQTDAVGCSVLWIGASLGNAEVVQTLIQYGAAVDQQDTITITSPLWVATSNANYDTVKALLEADADANLIDKDGWSPLLLAATNGECQICRLLIEHGAEVNFRDDAWGWSPIHIAALHGHVDTMEELIKSGADINMVTNEDSTPIQAAITNVHTLATKVLLNHGACSHIKDWLKLSNITEGSEDVDMVRLLRDHLTNINLHDTWSRRKSFIASIQMEQRLVELQMLQSNDLEAKCQSDSVSICSDDNPLSDVSSIISDKSIQCDLLCSTIDSDGLSTNSEESHPTCSLSFSTDDNLQCYGQTNEGIDTSNIDSIRDNYVPHIYNTSESVHGYSHHAENVGYLNNAIEMLLSASEVESSSKAAAVQPQRITATNYTVEHPKHETSSGEEDNHSDLDVNVITSGNYESSVNESINLDEGNFDYFMDAHVNAIQRKNTQESVIFTNAYHGLFDSVSSLQQVHVDDEDSSHRTLLWLACYHGDVNAVDSVLKKGANSNIQSMYGISPLIVATYLGHLDIVEMLMNEGAQIELCTVQGYSPLWVAAYTGNREMVECLLAHGAVVNPREGNTPLLIAAVKGDTHIIQQLINMGSLVNTVDRNKWSALSHAMKNGQANTVNVLLEQKDVDIKVIDNADDSLLHLAVSGGSINCVQLLVDHLYHIQQCSCIFSQSCQTILQMWLERKNNLGRSSLWLASFLGFDDILELLIEAGAHINTTDKTNTSAVHAAAKRGQYDTLTRLLQQRAKLTYNMFNETPMDCSIAQHDIYCFSEILQHTINDDIQQTFLKVLHENKTSFVAAILPKLTLKEKNILGKTALDIAIENNNTEIARMLLEAGVEITIQGDHNPFVRAIHHGSNDMVLLFLSHKVQDHISEHQGMVLTKEAAKLNREHIFKLLVLHNVATDNESNQKFGIMERPMKHTLGNEIFTLLSNTTITHKYHLLLDLEAENDMKACEMLLTHGLSKRDEEAHLIHHIAKGGELHLMNLLLKHTFYKQHIDSEDKEGNTPLHFAVGKGRESFKMASSLIKNGAQTNKKNSEQCTPLLEAINSYASSENITLLLENGAHAAVPDMNGLTPLSLAIEKNQPETIRVLLQHNASTSLHVAALYGSVDIVKRYIEREADKNAKDEKGETALHKACYHGNMEVVKYLIEEEHVDVNAIDLWGRTPLHNSLSNATTIMHPNRDADPKLALESHMTPCEVAYYLLSTKKADLHATDVNGWTPLHCAIRSSNLDLVMVLLDSCRRSVGVLNPKPDVYQHTLAEHALRGGKMYHRDETLCGDILDMLVVTPPNVALLNMLKIGQNKQAKKACKPKNDAVELVTMVRQCINKKRMYE